MDIHNKVVIVTGAAVGIGRAISERLLLQQAVVALTDINARKGAETLRRIQQASGRAAFREADITRDLQVQEVIDFAVDTFGCLDILINNAGGGGHIPPHFPEASLSQWGRILDLNLRTPLLATQLALVPMSRQGSGAVVNIGSTAGLGLGDYQSSPSQFLVKSTTTFHRSSIQSPGQLRGLQRHKKRRSNSGGASYTPPFQSIRHPPFHPLCTPIFRYPGMPESHTTRSPFHHDEIRHTKKRGSPSL